MNYSTAYLSFNGQIPSRKADSVAVVKTCSGFGNYGWDVELLIPRGQADSQNLLGDAKNVWEFYDIPYNFKITYLPCVWPNSRFGRLSLTIMAILYALAKGHHLFYARQIEFAYWSALLGKTTILESHNFIKVNQSPFFSKWINILRDPNRRAAMVVTTYASAQAYLDRGVPEKSLLVAPNGVEIERFSDTVSKTDLRNSLGLPINKTIIGFSGHLYTGRGIEEVITGAKKLNNLFYLFVGGDSADIERCNTFAQHQGVKNIKFIGFVPQAKVPAYIQASDILIMPYTSATNTHSYMSPMKMFDYMASGRPIIATDFPVVREVLKDKHNAIIVPPDSSETIVSGIQWLLDHPEAAARIGEQARSDAKQYSWDQRAYRIVNWCQELFNA